jgi:hypothetical protein
MNDNTTIQQQNVLLDEAWAVIANVSGGEWVKQSPAWREAAERLRDSYRALRKLKKPDDWRTMDLLDTLTSAAMTPPSLGLRTDISRQTLGALVRVVRYAILVNRVHTIDERRDAHIELTAALEDLEQCIP